MLELRRRQLVDALRVNGLVVASKVQQPGSDLAAEEVVCAKRVQAHVARHGHELWTRQVVEGQIVVEEFGHVDDVCRRGRLARRPNLLSVSVGAFGHEMVERTLRKNSLNASLPTMCALA